MRLSRLIAFCTSLLLAGHAGAFTTTINPDSTSSTGTVTADDDPSSGSAVEDTLDLDSIPFSDSHIATDTSPQTSQSSANYSLTNENFNISLTQEHSDTGDSLAQASGVIFFSVDQDIRYILSGNLSVVDPDLGGGPRGKNVLLAAELRNLTDTSILFNQLQRSDGRANANQEFNLGDNPGTGDAENLGPLGSLEGDLFAGDVYRLTYTASISNLDGSDVNSGSAQATGLITLNLVPEPSTALLLGAGVMALGLRRRR